MGEPSLQATLRDKYNISDTLLAEGRFVGLIGDHATNLVCLGLGIRCLVIAKVVLSGDVIDYELMSLLPLRMLSLSYQNLAKKIKVRSQFRLTQVYQLCTSANEAEVWDNFTSTIREVYMPEQGDVWCITSLQPPKRTDLSPGSSAEELDQRSTIDNSCSSDHELIFPKKPKFPRNADSFSNTNSADFEQSSVDFSRYSSVSTMSYKSISSFQKFDSRLSESSESLPPKLPSQKDENNNWCTDSRRSQSMVLFDIKFDSFVNDSPTVSSECSDISIASISESDMVTLAYCGDKINISNNFIEARNNSDTISSETREQKDKSDGRLSKVFRRVLSCCTNKSKH